MKKFLGVLLSVCLLLGLTAFPAAASGETSDRVMFGSMRHSKYDGEFLFYSQSRSVLVGNGNLYRAPGWLE